MLGGLATNLRLEVVPTLNLDWGMFFIPWFFRTNWFTSRIESLIFGFRYFLAELGLVQEAVFSISFLIPRPSWAITDQDGVIKM
ncbi:MAG: hypothetical protein EBT88_13050 [Proteobacteria bacterium]|nr:hypothetical protein [Pseudomonadota bacterium]